jgi:hypothetical protein
MEGLIQTVFSMLRNVPAAVWGVVVGATLSWPTVILSQRHARKLQDKQLLHDAVQRREEREMSWRRDVYLDAAEALSRLPSALGRIGDLSISIDEVSRSVQNDLAARL